MRNTRIKYTIIWNWYIQDISKFDTGFVTQLFFGSFRCLITLYEVDANAMR